MLPGVSTEDCLFADLGIDPAAGCQSYEATDFLLNGRRIDTSAALVLWQAGVVGDLRYRQGPATDGLRVLVDHLLHLYPGDHRVMAYEAATLPVFGSRAVPVPLGELAEAELSPMGRRSAGSRSGRRPPAGPRGSPPASHRNQRVGARNRRSSLGRATSVATDQPALISVCRNSRSTNP
jgi:hypothetical protein